MRALISVFDKTGVVDFARGLADLGVELFSTGGTEALLRENGVDVRGIQELTGFPEILGGRVKTLHPLIHAGILALRGDPATPRRWSRVGAQPIDIVVANLYPFRETRAGLWPGSRERAGEHRHRRGDAAAGGGEELRLR